MATQRIPFLDLVTPHRELRGELMEVFAAALQSATFVGGPSVEQFEQEFASFCQAAHCIGVNSGTDALRFALLAAGVGAGDIVVTVPNTFIATTEAISQTGASPVFVDVDAETHGLDPRQLQHYLDRQCRIDGNSARLVDVKRGKNVAAVVPVHLYGMPAAMDEIGELADRYKLLIVEDACQAHGAKYFSQTAGAWKTAGSIGRIAAFSFYPGKNLGACGEAGAVTTSDAGIAEKIRMLRDHGQSRKYFHEVEGYNGRLDALQAGILLKKLPHLLTWNEQRRRAAQRYRELLVNADLAWLLGHEPDWAASVYHLFVIRVPERDRLIRHLAEAGIGTGIHYPVPLHLQNAYRSLGYRKGDFPVAEAAAEMILSLPMYPSLKPQEQQSVVEALKSFMVDVKVGTTTCIRSASHG